MELIVKQARWLALYLRLRRIYLEIRRNPDRFKYRDLAITPVTDDEVETREMFQNDAAQAYVDQEFRLQEIRGGGHAKRAQVADGLA
jgi:hypothetical protein